MYTYLLGREGGLALGRTGSAKARWGARPWPVSAWRAGAGGQSSEETSNGTL